MIWAHSRKDALLVSLSVFTVAMFVAEAFVFDRFRWGVHAGVVVVGFALVCTNWQCVAHDFIHTPFFKSPRMNTVFSVFNSIALGSPQTLYRFHHLNHHKYNNDAFDPVRKTTDDMTSIYRCSAAPPEPEGIVRYSLRASWRVDGSWLYNEAKRRKLERLVKWEVAAMLTFLVFLVVVKPWAAGLYVIAKLGGEILAGAENYLEHYGATPGDRLRDSASCYGRFYNFVWFNNGYHQEHHYRPQVHWSKLPSLRPQMAPEDTRRVVPFAHLANWPGLIVRRHGSVPTA